MSGEALDRLAGDIRDDLEILVEVQHGQSGEFGRGGDDQIRDRRSPVLASIGEKRQHLHRSVLDSGCLILDRHGGQRKVGAADCQSSGDFYYAGAMPTYRPMSLSLETDRLVLRPWIASDVDDYRALVSERDPRARPHERGDGMPTVENIRNRIATQLAATARTGIALLPVRRRAEGDFIGYCGLIVGRATAEEPEIAYELLRRAHGHGYATEAARAVLDAAVATGRSRLWSTVASWNAPSLRVLQKLGFQHHHVTADEDEAEIVWLTRVLP